MSAQGKQISQVLAEKRRQVFLKLLARTGKVIVAARAVGLSDATTLYAFREVNEDFAAAWDAAILASADLLEEAAWDRAVNGVEKPILFKGEVVATEVQYSDSLMIEMLRARKPKEYRRANQSVDVNVDVHAKVGIAMIPLTATNPSAWEQEAKLVHEQQKQLPSFVDPEKVVDAEFTDVPKTTEPVAPTSGKKSEPNFTQKEMGRA